MIPLNQSINTTQEYAAWIQIVISFILNEAIESDVNKKLIHWIMKLIDHYQSEKEKKYLD